MMQKAAIEFLYVSLPLSSPLLPFSLSVFAARPILEKGDTDAFGLPPLAYQDCGMKYNGRLQRVDKAGSCH